MKRLLCFILSGILCLFMSACMIRTEDPQPAPVQEESKGEPAEATAEDPSEMIDNDSEEGSATSDGDAPENASVTPDDDASENASVTPDDDSSEASSEITEEESSEAAEPEEPYAFYFGKKMSEYLAEVNQRTLADPGAKIADLFAERTYTAADVLAMIRSYQYPNKTVYGDRWDIQNVQYELNAYMNTGALDAAPQDPVPVRYGILTDNASVRAFPTDLCAHNIGDSAVWDYFQETKLSYGDGVIVFHQTADSLWSFVQGLNYYGWVHTDCIAFCERDAFLDYLTQDNFLVRTAVTPGDASPLNRMGVILPLKDEEADEDSRTVILPERAEDGTLVLTEQVIGEPELSAYYHEGFLAYSPEALLETGRTMLDYPYGYGDLNSNYDCSSFAGLVYRCFGIFTPRNSGDMPHAAGLTVVNVTGADDYTKAQLVMDHPGAIIGWPGHVMMSSGRISSEAGDKPGVIHCNTAYYNAPDGDPAHYVVTEKVLEVPVGEIYGASGVSFLSRLEYVIWLDMPVSE